jgi:archaemetzincin
MEEVRAHVERVFGFPARLWTGLERPTGAFDPARGQHSSTLILRWLRTARPPEAYKVLGLTDADLFIPVLTFVFGEAQLDGAVAVVSAARLQPNPRGRGVDRRMLTARLAKECIHELGHTFGLLHCTDPRCVMARSVTVFDVDAKQDALCQNCRLRFQELQHRGSRRWGHEGNE